LGLSFVQCKSDEYAILATEVIKEPTSEQLKEASDCLEEEHHAIIFLYKSAKQKYGKLIQEMEYDILQNNDLSPKTVGDMCQVLAG